MVFGNPHSVAIEVGETDAQIDPPQIYIQLRFVLFGQHIGDWDDRVPITMAWRNMEDFLNCKNYRRDFSLNCVDSETFFEMTFSAFYERDARKPPIIPNFRDRYHLSEVGGDSICDLFGIAVAEVAPNRSRVVAKDFRADQIILDDEVDSDELDRMGQEFVAWARHEYGEN